MNQLLSEISADVIKKHKHQLIDSNLNKCQLIVTKPNALLNWWTKQNANDIFFTFQYICYPWKNDDQIDPKNRRKTCRQDDDCDPGQECFRHHDKRMVNRGLCFDEVRF